MIKKVFVFISLFNFSLNQDIVFPGDEIQMKIKIKINDTTETTTTSAINVITSTPATTSEKQLEKCPVNMTIIEDNGEYICECVSGYLYYPPLEGCFQPYTRGPCSSGNYLAISPGAFTAECLENPCEEGSVMYQNECHKLLKSGPPCNGSETLIVNEENYEINCQEVIPVVYQVIMAPVRRCAPGSRMAAHGICRQLL